MASSTVNVARYTALALGITYGIFHQSTLQKSYDEKKASRAVGHRAHLVEEARSAWAKKQLGGDKKSSGVISDPEDPKFDLEKLVNSWTEKA